MFILFAAIDMLLLLQLSLSAIFMQPSTFDNFFLRARSMLQQFSAKIGDFRRRLGQLSCCKSLLELQEQQPVKNNNKKVGHDHSNKLFEVQQLHFIPLHSACRLATRQWTSSHSTLYSYQPFVAYRAIVLTIFSRYCTCCYCCCTVQ